MKLQNKTIEVKKNDDLELKLFVRSFEKNNLLGFVSLSVYRNGKFSSAYNNFSINKKDDDIFLSEPQDKYTNKDDETKYTAQYIAPKAIKEDIVKILKENFK